MTNIATWAATLTLIWFALAAIGVIFHAFCVWLARR